MRGITMFVVMIVIAIFFCGFVPFTFLPSIDAAMALPVISVPGEVLINDFPVLGTFTNTMVGTLIADVLVLLFILPVTMGLKKVPGRMQVVVELIGNLFHGLAVSVAGPKNGRKIFPLAATIFIFLLMANWIELIPGVDSIGMVHCAHEGFNGYETKEGPLGTTQLVVSENLDAGTPATHADYEACKARHDAHAEEEGEHEDEEAAMAEEGEHEDEASSEEGADSEDDHSEEGTAAASTDDHSEGDAAGAEEGEHAEGRDDIEIITPYVRAAATDLNLTLALAVIAVVVIQGFGVAELGWGYPAKFINTPALEKGDVMTFGVGFLELVSEISKIISFAFRLFGNIFAGQILLFVIPFLVATLLPGAIYGLEFAVGLIQAGIFAMLFLVFAGIAMTSHDHDDEHH